MKLNNNNLIHKNTCLELTIQDSYFKLLNTTPEAQGPGLGCTSAMSIENLIKIVDPLG